VPEIMGESARIVVQAYTDDGTRSWYNLVWILSSRNPIRAGHVLHLSVVAMGEPGVIRTELGDGMGRGNAHQIKPQVACFVADLLCQAHSI